MTKSATVLAEIAAERYRQIDVEGWSADHDDGHFAGELARAAAAYAVHASVPEGRTFQADVYGQTIHHVTKSFRIGWFLPALMLWPWDAEWWKPKDRRRDLIRAGALIVAEIERLDRAAANPDTAA